MVSTGTETAQATVLGPGFDSQQVHDYDLCDIYKPLYSPCATTSLLLLRLEVLQPFQELLSSHPLSHSFISACRILAAVANAISSDSIDRILVLIRFTLALARSRSNRMSAHSSFALACRSATDPVASRNCCASHLSKSLSNCARSDSASNRASTPYD
jgi:hypothetical protein